MQRWKALAPQVAVLADKKFERRADLAKALRVSESTLSCWLSGTRTPELESAMRLVEKIDGRWGQLLGETPASPPAVPREAQEAAERLARDAAELAKHLRAAASSETLAGADSGQANHPEPPAEVREKVIPFPSRPAAIGLMELKADVDEPREVHWTEVPVVAFAAAGEGRAVEEPTGETKMLLNTSARLVEAGRLFVSKVVGDSMEPDFRNGDYVLFERTSTSTVQKGQVVLVMAAGETMLKILDFERRDDGHLVDVKLVSLNAAPIHPDPETLALLGRVVEKLARVPDYKHLLER